MQHKDTLRRSIQHCQVISRTLTVITDYFPFAPMSSCLGDLYVAHWALNDAVKYLNACGEQGDHGVLKKHIDAVNGCTQGLLWHFNAALVFIRNHSGKPTWIGNYDWHEVIISDELKKNVASMIKDFKEKKTFDTEILTAYLRIFSKFSKALERFSKTKDSPDEKNVLWEVSRGYLGCKERVSKLNDFRKRIDGQEMAIDSEKYPYVFRNYFSSKHDRLLKKVERNYLAYKESVLIYHASRLKILLGEKYKPIYRKHFEYCVDEGWSDFSEEGFKALCAKYPDQKGRIFAYNIKYLLAQKYDFYESRYRSKAHFKERIISEMSAYLQSDQTPIQYLNDLRQKKRSLKIYASYNEHVWRQEYVRPYRRSAWILNVLTNNNFYRTGKTFFENVYRRAQESRYADQLALTSGAQENFKLFYSGCMFSANVYVSRFFGVSFSLLDLFSTIALKRLSFVRYLVKLLSEPKQDIMLKHLPKILSIFNLSCYVLLACAMNGFTVETAGVTVLSYVSVSALRRYVAEKLVNVGETIAPGAGIDAKNILRLFLDQFGGYVAREIFSFGWGVTYNQLSFLLAGKSLHNEVAYVNEEGYNQYYQGVFNEKFQGGGSKLLNTSLEVCPGHQANQCLNLNIARGF